MLLGVKAEVVVFRTPAGNENESDGIETSSSNMHEVSPEMLSSDWLLSVP